MKDRPTIRIARPRLLLFAFGDFAFNLYWQSIMLFLLFYYTEVLRLPVGLAAATYLVALFWDGVVSLAVGVLADRLRETIGYRRLLLFGPVPLGVSFVLAYLPPSTHGSWAAAAVLGTHLLFRTGYALVNIPYLAMTARVTADSGDRALLAGARMLFGAAALLAVTLGTVPLGGWISGSGNPATIYLAAAGLFAAVGTAILMAVALFVPEVVADPIVRQRPSLRAASASLARNRAFVTLNLAMACIVIASTILTKSVLYFYKYGFGDEAAGHFALASMGTVGLVAVPIWTLVCRGLGGRATWLLCSGLAVALLAGFAAFRIGDPRAMQGFLTAMQAALIGLHIVFWAMLPNTVEYGERSSGLRLEGAVFGVATLLQRVAMGAATGVFGIALAATGYRADSAPTPATIEGLRLIVAVPPLLFVALAAGLMVLNPLTRRAHAAIVDELSRTRRER
ncbi:MFS transporter [Sphingomonas hengshuiensis]|uniref:Sugar transporter n=1 Tax=Sphingomonas hengshuiensis TaxID=1609977 RepID=A0A7U4LEQ6_9SPHN|nr:MFS transporter [Sphingomonas hengshuiensis]AJP71645.1 hypothetical protein TS85_07365 [Sphingomonas hengshuiensis]